MGKPIQRKWFGPVATPGSQIVVSGVKWADGTTATSDYIVKQTGSTAYIVSNGTKSETVFMVNATDVTDLNPGECFILATPFGGSARPCAKIAQYRLDLYEADGSIGSYSWSTIPASAPGQADLIAGAGAVGALLTLAPLAAGSGYFTAPTVIFAGGGSGGAAHVTIAGADGHVATSVIDSAGVGYTGVSLTAPPASVTAVLTPSLTNGALSLAVANAGTNGYYDAVPVVTVAAPPAAVTATATPPLNDGAGGVTLGALAGITGGGYYTSIPAVTLGGGNGDAVAVATVVNGAVATITVTGAGTGFAGLVTVTVDAPPAAVAGSATAVLTGHRVTSLVAVAGSGYFTVPVVSVAAPDVAPVQATLTATFSA